MNINLYDYLDINKHVLVGKVFGSNIRKILDLNTIDKNNEIVIVQIPESILFMTTSFFIGLFGPSVVKLNKYGFKNKYNFVCNKMIYEVIEDGISRSLNKIY